jgi:hypothetical protein
MSTSVITPDSEGSMDFGSAIVSDDEASMAGEEAGQPADDAVASAAAAVAESSNTSNIVNGLTRQLSSDGKGIKWAPNLVTYMGSNPDFDTEMSTEGSVHLSDGSFQMTSGADGGGVDDFNTGMHDMSYRQVSHLTVSRAVLVGDFINNQVSCFSPSFSLSVDLFPTLNSAFDLDGFAEASMNFEGMDFLDFMENMDDDDVAADLPPVSHMEGSLSSDRSFQFDENKSDVVMESAITSAPKGVPSETGRGLEREASMHLSEVFNLSDLRETPAVQDAAVPKGPGQLSDFLESGGTPTRLAGVRQWIKEKLDEQEDSNNNNRRKPMRDQGDESQSSLSESTSQMSAANLPPGGVGWVPLSSSQQV